MNAKERLNLNNQPNHWSILSERDQLRYRQLQQSIVPLCFRTTRGEVSMKFQIILMLIKRYTNRHDDDDWKRCFVCGVVWLENVIAVNTRQLSKLTDKSKSSINFGFQAIGYKTVTMSPTQASEMISRFPLFSSDSNEIHQWTIRMCLIPRIKQSSFRMFQPSLITFTNSGHAGKDVDLTESEGSLAQLRMSESEPDSFMFHDDLDDIFVFSE
jgi:hypothetical protein